MFRSENTLKNAFHNNKRKELAANKKDGMDEDCPAPSSPHNHKRAPSSPKKQQSGGQGLGKKSSRVKRSRKLFNEDVIAADDVDLTELESEDEVEKRDKAETPHRRSNQAADGIVDNETAVRPKRQTRHTRALNLDGDPVRRKIDMDEAGDDDEFKDIKCDLNTLALSAQALWTSVPSPSKVHGSINTRDQDLHVTSPTTARRTLCHCIY